MKRYPAVKTVLLIVNVLVLILPVGGLVFFRIYENKLVQETEVELISQAALIGALLKERIVKTMPSPETHGIPVSAGRRPAPDQSARYTPKNDPSASYDPRRHLYYTPQEPLVDLAKNDVLPSRPDGAKPKVPPDPDLLTIGEEITRIFIDAQKTTLAGMRLLDHRGIVIAGRNEIGLSFAHVEEVQRGLSGQYTSVLRQRLSDATPPIASISRGTFIRIFVAYPVIHDSKVWGVVYLSRTPNNIIKDMYAERDRLILAGLTILGLTIALGLFTSWTISRPIHELIRRAKRTTAGDNQMLQPLERPGTKELALLSGSFSDMANALQQRSTYLRDFASRISHEFKTPLTAIRGSAELLGEHRDTMSDDERSHFINNILADTDRLKQLTNRLLELARADNIVPAHDAIEIRPVLERIKAQHESPNCKIDVTGPDNVKVPISDDNLESVLSNLVVNALQHAATAVTIDLHADGGTATLTVTDNGQGVSKLNRDKIFDPFFTTRREEGGTGLGLRIVHSIMEAHGGSIEFDDDARETRFILKLPSV